MSLPQTVAEVRTERRRNPDTGVTYPWVVSSTAMVTMCISI